MSRRSLTSALAIAVLAAIGGPVGAEPERDDETEQIVGAYGGITVGGGTTPGGLQLGGSYLYRLSDVDWIDGSVGFTIGRGDGGCFRDRQDVVLCDHRALDGFAGEVGVAIRRQLDPQASLNPFLRLGLAVRLVSYAADDVRGVGVPLVAGGGVRVRIAPHVQIVAASEVRAGFANLGRGLGGEPHLSFSVLGGVEFELH